MRLSIVGWRREKFGFSTPPDVESFDMFHTGSAINCQFSAPGQIQLAFNESAVVAGKDSDDGTDT